MKEEFIEICRSCDKWEIIECDFDYDLISEFGKTVFATREEAEGLKSINTRTRPLPSVKSVVGGGGGGALDFFQC